LIQQNIPTYIKDFVHAKMKSVKIHLLNHFVDYIHLYGSFMNFNGAITEFHLKTK